jgi:hypothetical protein
MPADDDVPVLGLPVDVPESVWTRVVSHALDPDAEPVAADLVPDDVAADQDPFGDDVHVDDAGSVVDEAQGGGPDEAGLGLDEAQDPFGSPENAWDDTDRGSESPTDDSWNG